MDKYQQYAKDWEDIWMTCGRKETALFEAHSVAYTNEVVTQNARKNLMVWMYRLLRNSKRIIPIENLEVEVKQKMWDFVKEVCAGKTDDIERMKHVAQVFYAIEYFINENQ